MELEDDQEGLDDSSSDDDNDDGNNTHDNNGNTAKTKTKSAQKMPREEENCRFFGIISSTSQCVCGRQYGITSRSQTNLAVWSQQTDAAASANLSMT